MKLTVRYWRDQVGNDIPVLCDADGRILPNQRDMMLSCKVHEELTSFTVTFDLDGESIASVAEPAVVEE